ncbi:long-chain-fatty-acid--CoA ligase [Desulfobacterium sp. N47]|uniref:Long-chain-fatty-acid--CoA ligase n=1 Tax=uncultured Desulfobacterium sp. TaxID=201089 RepID=E1YGH2_9BACT|nr:Long-chain-fatty-acid--CoA ligase [uncultured Desulfobacterium sp.]
MLNLATLLESSARKRPNHIAVIYNEIKLSYATVINEAANKVASGLVDLGIQPGDKIALSCLNLPYFPIVYYGILKAGAVVVPLNVLLKPREIAYHLKSSDAKAYFCFEGTKNLPMGKTGWEGFNETATCDHFIIMTADPAAPSPIDGADTSGKLIHNKPPVFPTVQTNSSDDTAVIMFTSGTTGQPKGAELTHLNMVFNARLSDTMYETHPDDVHLITLPLFHSFGQSLQMNAVFYNGATITLLPRFNPDAAFSIMQRDNVTFFAGVPTMYWALLNHPEAEKYNLDKIYKTLRYSVSGGSPMSLEVMKAFNEKFHIKILEGYGLSETSPAASFNRINRESKAGSVGLPVWGVQIRIVSEKDEDVPQGELGELIIQGHNVMKGYYKKPSETKEAFKNGWFHTGDIGRFDEDGYIYIVDRVKDIIIRGGFNVYPREIEEILLSHPDISIAAVIGVPDDRYGEEIKAFVVRKKGAESTEEKIRLWARENMAAYKYPRQIDFRDTLPMSATGKILKKELKQKH